MEAGAVQSFAYEKKGDSAVIWRCFSRDTKAVIPDMLDGLPVTGLAPYAFSAHMDEAELERGLRAGRLHISRSVWMDAAGAGGEQTTSDDAWQEKLSVMSLDDGPREERISTSEMAQLKKLGIPALCGDRLEELELPASVVRVGRYCFYNCGHLGRLSFTGKLQDWGSGVFTGCHQIREIRVQVEPGGASMLKDLLDEVREELLVVLEESGEQSFLMFPEFYEEGVENTPARILETHVHGSGILYRNCFKNRRLDFRQYDELFVYAVARESEEFLVRQVLYRLRSPRELSEKARAQYEDYMRAHLRDFAEYLVRKRRIEEIRWMCERLRVPEPAEAAGAANQAGSVQDGLWQKKDVTMQKNCRGSDAVRQTADRGSLEIFLDLVQEAAGRARYAEAMSYVMDYRHAYVPPAPKKRRKFEL